MNKITVVFILALLAIGLRLFIYDVYVEGKSYNLYFSQPGSDGIFTADSGLYVDCSSTLISHGKFARIDDQGKIEYQLFRTPGYSVFLAFLRGLFKFSLNQVILAQIFLSVLTAFVVYKIAEIVSPEVKYLSALFMLFDVSTTKYTIYIMTETLFTFFIALFAYRFIIYMRSKKVSHLIISGVLLALSAYIRPIAYFLVVPVVTFYFLVYFKDNPKQTIKHMGLLVGLVYGFIWIWHVRNYMHLGVFRFSSIGDITVGGDGLIGSYKRLDVPASVPVWLYYSGMFSNLIARMVYNTTIFNSPDSLITYRFGYLYTQYWVLAWIIGFMLGMLKLRKNIYLWFFIFLILYFTACPVFGAMKGAGERFRVPMIPFIAILSSLGWRSIYCFFRGNK